MYLIDTNILVYYIEGKMISPSLRSYLSKSIFRQRYTISDVTKIELLGWVGYENGDDSVARHFINRAIQLPINQQVVEQAIILRRKYNMGLGDSIVAATAKIHDLPLLTRNVKDFKKVKGIEVVNPFDIDAATGSV